MTPECQGQLNAKQSHRVGRAQRDPPHLREVVVGLAPLDRPYDALRSFVAGSGYLMRE